MEFYLQDADVGGEDGVHGLLDVGVLLLHAVGVAADRVAVFWWRTKTRQSPGPGPDGPQR